MPLVKITVEQLEAPVIQGLWEAAVNWLNDAWKWAERLVGQGGASTHAVVLVVIVLAVVLLGSWAQSRIAQS